MPKKISNEVLLQAQELRTQGKSYEEISKTLQVSMSWCWHSLVNVEKFKQPMKYVTYVAHDGKDAIYVGHGADKRHNHVNSGTSHVYQLNRDHFDGINYNVEVFTFDCKKHAEELEELFIVSFNPKYNKRIPIPK